MSRFFVFVYHNDVLVNREWIFFLKDILIAYVAWYIFGQVSGTSSGQLLMRTDGRRTLSIFGQHPELYIFVQRPTLYVFKEFVDLVLDKFVLHKNGQRHGRCTKMSTSGRCTKMYNTNLYICASFTR
jgi:hypothetical protein